MKQCGHLGFIYVGCSAGWQPDSVYLHSRGQQQHKAARVLGCTGERFLFLKRRTEENGVYAACTGCLDAYYCSRLGKLRQRNFILLLENKDEFTTCWSPHWGGGGGHKQVHMFAGWSFGSTPKPPGFSLRAMA